MVGTTVDELVSRVQRDSLLASRGPLFQLSGSHDAVTTSITLTDMPSHIGQGEMVSVDYELMYVQASSSTSNVVTVIRGFLGTTAATHADLAIMEVAPRFPKATLLDGAFHEIASWERKLFRVSSADLPITAGQTHYSLASLFTGPVYNILDVRFEPVEDLASWWTWSWTGDRWARAQARLQRGKTANPDEVEIQFRRRPLSDTTARVSVAQPFDLAPFTGSTDLVTDVGLRSQWFEILEAGMKWRALTSGVIGRSDWRTSNVARQAEEVTPLDTVRAASHLRDLRESKLSDAMVALIGEWPWREQ
jgi:hypothetical protein